MTCSRFFLLCFGLLLMGTVMAGFYLYQNLPDLLRQQARHYLQQYGVDDIEFEGLHITRSDMTAETLVLRGTYNNYAYQATLTSGKIQYNWRVLFGAKIDSLSLSSLDLTATQTTAGENHNSGLIAVDSLLPQQVKALLPLKSLGIAQWNLKYHTSNSPAITASGSLLLNDHLDAQIQAALAGGDLLARVQSDPDSGHLDLDLSLRKAQSDIATLTAKLAPTVDNEWRWDISGHALHNPLLLWLRDINAQQQLEMNVPKATELSLHGESAFTAQLHHPNELNLATAPGSQASPLQQLTASFNLTSDIRLLDIHGIVGSVNGALNLEGTLASGDFQATVQPFKLMGELSTQTLSLRENWRQWMGWEDAVSVQLEAVEKVEISSAWPAESSLQAKNALLSLGDKDSRLSFQQLTINVAVTGSEQIEARTQLSAVLNTRLRKQTFPTLAIALTQQGNTEASAFSLHLEDAAASMRADLTGDISLSRGKGKYQLNAAIGDLSHFSTIALPLLQHFELLEDTVEIRSGTVRLDTALESETFDVANWEQHSRLALENVTGSINEYRFEGLDVSAHWTGIEDWKTLQPLEFSLAKLNTGFEVKDIQWRASLPKATPVLRPDVRIEAFSANMFGGQLIMPDAQAWDFAAASNQVTLQALRWQLSELVALQPNVDIQARGTLEGELPLTVTDGRIIINQGYLRALPPGGTIRYQANDKSRALSKDSAELQLALDLLSDFQYQVLSSEVELDKAGNLLLGLSLEGSNPERYEGQSINFNINLEQNIDPLLQSLRLSDNLVEQIEGGLK